MSDSGNSDVEYLDLDNFSDLDDEQAFREFCCDLAFEPYGEQSLESIPSTHKRKADSSHNENNFTTQDIGKRSKKTFVPDNHNKVQKTDIRRTYAQQFSDAFNGCDTKILASLLNSLCSPQVSVMYKYIGKSNPYGPMFTEIFGIAAVGVFWDTIFMAIPDSVYSLHGEPKVTVLPSGYSAITCKFTYEGTKVFHIDSMVEGSTDRVIIHSEVATPATTTHNVFESGSAKINAATLTDDVFGNVTAVQNAQFGLGTSRRAQVVFVVGTLTLHVDPQNKVYKFDFIYSIKE